MENQDQTATIEKNNLLYYKQNKPHLLSRGDFWRIAESEAFLSNLPETRFDGYWPLYLSDYLLEEKTRKIFQPSLSSVTSDLPKSESKYLLGKMVTGAMTTSSAIGWIASATGVARSDITVASHKDSSSISAQLICLPRIAAEKLKETVLPQGLLMGNWQPTDSTLSSSDFAGNRHMVAVRTESEVDLTAFSIKIDMITKYGFLNYFSPTHWGDRLLFARFGRLAIEGKYAAAIEMFLFEGSMSGGKLASSIRLEAEKSRGDQAKSLALWSVLPQTFANELKVVKYLEANPGDFLGALQQIKDQVARWIFAYGASLFNEALSHLASNKGVINEKLPWPFSPEASALPIYQELMLRDRTDKYLASPFMVDSPLLKGQEMPGRIFPTQLTFKPFNRGIVIDCLMGGTQTIQPLLMNIFNLNNALPAPSWADSGVVDIKKILNQGDNSDLLSSFLA